MADFFHKNW